MLGCFLNNSPSLEKLTLQYCEVLSFLLIYHVWYPCFTIFLTTCTNTVYCHKLPEGSKKRKRMENPKRMSIKCHDALTFQCPSLKLTEIKYKEDDVHQLFGLLSGIWRNLRKTTIILTKAWSIKSQYLLQCFWRLVALKCGMTYAIFCYLLKHLVWVFGVL